MEYGKRSEYKIKNNGLDEKSINSKKIYCGKIINLRVDEVSLPDGKKSTREIVEHPGAVVILAQDEKSNIMMVKQYRKSVEQVLLELPAGTFEPAEEALTCARRELEEETGYIAQKWTKIFDFYSSPGFCNEKLILYFAQKLTRTKTNTDHDEFIEVVDVNKKDICQLIKDNQIKDAKTLVGLLWWLKID